MKPSFDVVIVGAGVYGVTAAIELARRKLRVEMIDPGPLPRPEASSTDLSKAVRMDYGDDELYTDLGAACIEGWREWNRIWDRALYHEVGFLLMTRETMRSGSYESNGFDCLRKRGHFVERLATLRLAERFPAWNAEVFADGYLNPTGGWAESGEVMRRLLRRAEECGVAIRAGCAFAELLERGSRVAGVATTDGQLHHAPLVLVAAGAWTPTLLPQLSHAMWATGQPVLHFRPADPAPFAGERFPVWGADISDTGWYGFPANADGIVKIGNHGPGSRIHPEAQREVDPQIEARCREFLSGTLPALAAAPLVGSRLCLYCDAFDGDFWIDHDPAREGLVVAAGGSGHGFKFAPLLGAMIADAVERKTGEALRRFAWREPRGLRTEQARFDG